MNDIPVRYVKQHTKKTDEEDVPEEYYFKLYKKKPDVNPIFGVFDEQKDEMLWEMQKEDGFMHVRSVKEEHLRGWVKGRFKEEDKLKAMESVGAIRFIPIFSHNFKLEDMMMITHLGGR